MLRDAAAEGASGQAVYTAATQSVQIIQSQRCWCGGSDDKSMFHLCGEDELRRVNDGWSW
jgi:hypothetical protein